MSHYGNSSVDSSTLTTISTKGNIHRIFRSIQGEGPLLCTPMIFVRFAGCNMRCLWCDEPNALPLDSGKPMTIPEIMEQIEKLAISDQQSASSEPRTPNPFFLATPHPPLS